MARWRFLLGATFALLVGVAVPFAASRPADEPTRTPPPPTPTPVATATAEPEPPAETDRPADDPAPDREPKTERHVIRGSGSIAVVSGTFEQGESSGGQAGSYTGPPLSPTATP
jgi:hypothetical protein